MIRNPKFRPYPTGFLVKPGMTRFLTPGAYEGSGQPKFRPDPLNSWSSQE